MLNAVEANQPIATLILDTSMNSLTFYKYKGTLLDGRDSAFLTPSALARSAKYAIKHGDTLAIFLPLDVTLQSLFEPRHFLPQTLVKTELTDGVLSIYQEGPDDNMSLDRDFKFVIIVRSDEIPDWAHEFIGHGRLRVIRIV
eukprot:CAMPEP_0204901980 /NCGR_PEP_ID=MMETSP1397-20131031/3400_1 /ASSEMBLY_ACC=CAM_ASM_000891 /TAXON_ID=49980 /ORGANISM="Climacostomum Climacostomum virens, Strain Stock W-24" /LENGTH=141 /DNA_ID=CAMNT_0052070419 /DNA_START=84 /DNA_END=509 /DNA_ORIENTATION=+